MNRASRFIAMGLLFVCAALHTGCSINGDSSDQSVNARKYWDRCLGTQCPPMEETGARKK